MIFQLFTDFYRQSVSSRYLRFRDDLQHRHGRLARHTVIPTRPCLQEEARRPNESRKLSLGTGHSTYKQGGRSEMKQGVLTRQAGDLASDASVMERYRQENPW